MTSSQEGFLIGALLLFPADILRQRVYEGYMAAGFTDLRPVHETPLGVLRPEGDRVVDLAKRARSSKQAMGHLVGYLEEHGYLERVPDPKDGRAQIVRRTEKGWEVNRVARREVEKLQQEWTEQLGQEHMEQLLILLRELVQVIGIEYKDSVSEISTRPK